MMKWLGLFAGVVCIAAIGVMAGLGSRASAAFFAVLAFMVLRMLHQPR